jgi:hypothetical protein
MIKIVLIFVVVSGLHGVRSALDLT